MRTKKRGNQGPPSETDYEILHLKRAIVAPNAGEHSCDKCIGILVKPLPEPFQRAFTKSKDYFRLDVTTSKVQKMAASGCAFWTMIQERLEFEAFKVVLEQQCSKVEYNLQKHDGRWSNVHYEALAASMGEEQVKEYQRLCQVMRNLPWRSASRDDESVGAVAADVAEDFVRILVAYTNIDDDNPGDYDDQSAKVDVNIIMRPNPAGERFKSVRWISFWVSFFALGLPGKQTYVGSPSNTTPDSLASMSLIQSWLRKCEIDHNCGIKDRPSSMPSFLLDVSCKQKVKLVSVTQDMRERYIALSYCWGVGIQKTMLKIGNKNDLMSGLELHHFDPTIQDAMKVTRELNFQFLWIDALCIIQDDYDFKAKELGKMGNIYQCATFTIIASAAKDVKQGFLRDRHATIGPARDMTAPQPIFKIKAYGKRGKHYVQVPILLTPYHFDYPEPWYTRAWTFQELLFSRRRLQYLNNRTTWSCYRGEQVVQHCDGWIIGKAHTHPGYGIAEQETFSDVMEILKNPGDAQFKSSELLEYWCELVDMYCTRKVTYQSDRLPAISAIAQEFAVALKDKYICGIWKSDLPSGLLWSSQFAQSDNKNPVRRPGPVERPKPTWSWSAYDDDVTWINTHLEKQKDPDFEILSHDIQLVSADAPFGEVKKGELRVRGLIIGIPLPTTSAENGIPVIIVEGMEMPAVIDYPDDPRLQQNSRSKLSALIVVQTGWSILEGIIVAEEENNRWSRVGWWDSQHTRTEPLAPGSTEKDSMKSAKEAYRAKLRSLWGGKENVREIVLM
uniref:Heterokaryon incompatibility domain-containing protein n=1 Tax=Colletotrichum fructicola (strain Nara gc5) TaxID=1213859 RepID=L2GDG3_COLFN